MIYILITCFLFSLCLFLTDDHKVTRKIFYYFIIIALFVFSAFRLKVGCDWEGYYNMFSNSMSIDWSSIVFKREFLFWTLSKAMNDLNIPYPFINVITSSIFFIGVHVLAQRQPNPLSFLVLLFPILILNMPMSAIRQAAAIGIICIAFTSLIDRRPIWFTIWVLLATVLHSSAIVFLLLIPFTTGRFNNNRLLISVLLSIPTLFMFAFLESAQTAKSIYIGTNREAYGGIFRLSILALTGFYFFFFLRDKWMKNFKFDYIIVTIGSLSMIMLPFLILLSSIIADRYGYYLIPIQAIIFSRLPYLSFKFNKSVHIILPYILIFLVLFVWTQSSWHFQKCYLPYDSWIFGLTNGNINY